MNPVSKKQEIGTYHLRNDTQGCLLAYKHTCTHILKFTYAHIPSHTGMHMCMYVHTSYILQTSSLIFQVSSGSIELHLEIFLLQIVNLRSENSVVKR